MNPPRYNFLKALITLLLVSKMMCATAQTNKDLNFYISTATENSPLLKDLSNQLLINRLDSAIIKANYKLHTGVNSTGTYAPIIHGFGYDDALSNGQSFSALYTVNQALFGKNRINNQVSALKLLSDSVSSTIKISRQDLKRNIISQYIAAYSSQQQNQFDKKVYELLKDQEVILKQLTRKSIYKQSDYLAFLVTVQQQELQMRQNHITYLNDVATLNYLSGITGVDSIVLSEPIMNVALAGQINQSIFLKQYSIDSLRILNGRKAIALNYQPQVGVYADAGYNSSFINKPYKNLGTSFGFTVSVPLYDGHQRKLQEQKLDIAEQNRMYYRDFFIKQYNQQLVQLKQQLHETETLFKKIDEQIKFTEGLIQVDGKLLQTGDITISDYLLAIRNYLDTQNTLRQTRIARLELINQLNFRTQ